MSINRIRVKIQRAKEHIRDLEPEVRTFLDSNPYVVGTKWDPQTRQRIYYLSSVKESPGIFSAIAGDILQNLRSSLDYLAHALFMAGTGGTAGPGKHIYFPIFDDAAK